MVKKKSKPQRLNNRKAPPKKCYFCEEKKEPEFKDVSVLQRFLTERGKIVPRSRSGLCTKHQKRLTLAIKYARHLSLLPFIARG
jgi:small subunit ribosomal protein S18